MTILNADWRCAPVVGFKGPADDSALLSLMLQKAHFKHLWELGGLAVVESFGVREAAVGALARELAYFTGRDHQRTFEFLQFSKLVTDEPMTDEALKAIVQVAVDEATDVFNTDSSLPATGAASAPLTTGLAQSQSAAARLSVLAKTQFRRHEKTDEIKGIFSNCVVAVAQPEFCGIHVGYDEFAGTPWIVRAKPGATIADREELTDDHYDEVRFNLEQEGFEYTKEGEIKKAIRHIGNINKHDSAKTWLNSLVWDGVPRVDTFCETYLGVESVEGNPYPREMGRYMLTAMAGRIIDPGCQADMTPVLIGIAGLRKSTLVEAMVPEKRMVCKINLGERGADLARMMVGCTIGLIDELRGLNTKDRESILSFLTEKEEQWVPKFIERGKRYPRRIFFIATANPDDMGFITDPAMQRRLPPLVVTKLCDTEGLKRDLMQLYAEGRELYYQNGVMWKEAERLSVAESECFKKRNSWLTTIAAWLNKPYEADASERTGKGVRGDVPFTTAEVALGALEIETRSLQERDERKICDALREIGYYSKQVSERHLRPYRWFKSEQLLAKEAAGL